MKNEAQSVYREVMHAADAAEGAYRETMDQVDDARRTSRTGSTESGAEQTGP